MKSDVDHLDEDLVERAKEFLELSDLNLMTESLKYNENRKDNSQMAVSLNLKNEIKNLNYNIKKLKKSTKISSWVMGIMTFFILVLTGVLVWKGL